MNKITIARALGMLTDVRRTMVAINLIIDPSTTVGTAAWVDTLDEAFKLIKNELTVEEAHSYARRSA